MSYSRQRYPRYVHLAAAFLLCLGFASLAFSAPIELQMTSDYRQMQNRFNGNGSSDEVFEALGSTCCLNNGWQNEAVADGLYLFNGAAAPVVPTDKNPTGFKTLLATSIDVKAGETYEIEAVGKSMQYTYAAQNAAPILSLLFGLAKQDGTMLWWESNHMTTQETSYSTLASLFTAVTDSQLYMLLVDMNTMFETNDGIAGLRVVGPENVPTPEPTSIVMLVGGLAAFVARRHSKKHAHVRQALDICPF